MILCQFICIAESGKINLVSYLTWLSQELVKYRDIFYSYLLPNRLTHHRVKDLRFFTALLEITIIQISLIEWNVHLPACSLRFRAPLCQDYSICQCKEIF